MKVAVTYDNGNVFQHFGRTENFKVYEVEEGKVVSSEVVSTNGEGHEALADLLYEMGVKAVICGGLGDGAQAALASFGIDVYSGAQGSADEAVEALLAGTLENAGVNCDHHEHEEEGCECGGDCDCGDDEEGCVGSCGGCGGGCHAPRPVILEGKNAGKKVRTHYEGTLDDGTVFDSSYNRGEPLEFVSGTGMMIAGYDKAVVDMEVGQTVNIHLEPSEAYGEINPNAILNIAIAELPGSEDLTVGQSIYLSDGSGRPFPVVVTQKDETNITLDANHPMAGKALNFKIELVSVEE